ncbi:MAG: hypothetical protein DWQ02_25075 [Bacteroidetes bacterium]|nr:MAG: hypothetical protein DWQ02_25075 [Bacteroidota bacterium]
MNFPTLHFRSLALTIILLASSTIIAQTTSRNIYELFGLKAGGCGLEILENPIQIQEVPEDMPMDFAQKKSEDLSNEQIENLFTSLRQSNILVKEPSRIIELKNGNTLFSQNKKWGLKNGEGTTLIIPSFDMVIQDTILGSFSGYKEAKCNYYDKSGKKVLSKDFYHIEAVGKSSFIVREASGYGLIINGKEILSATMKNIKKEANNGRSYYKIHSEEKGEYILLDDLTTEIFFPFWDKAQFIGQKYLKMTNNLINLETKKCLICEKGYEISILDEENQIAGFNKIGERVWYLIDFEGNLLTDQAFTYFRKFNDSGTAIAGIRNQGRGPYQISGLINTNGEWVLKPFYPNIYEAGKYIIATDNARYTTVHNQSGQQIIPGENQNILHVEKDLFVVSPDPNLPGANNYKPFLLDVKTEKKTEINAEFSRIRPIQFCDKPLFVASLGRQEMVLDEEFKPLTEVHQRIISINEGYMMGNTHNGAQNKRETVVYDCDGNTLSFNINGKQESIFTDFKVVSEDIFFIALYDGSNYLIKSGNPPVKIQNYINSFAEAKLGDYFIVNSFELKGIGMIDSKGNSILPFKFEYLSPFHPETNMAIFKLGEEKMGLVSGKGEWYRSELFESVRYVGNGYYALKKNKKFGLFNLEGVGVLPFAYDYIYLSKGMITASKSNKKEYYDLLIHKVK